jgi:hypothetical protein
MQFFAWNYIINRTLHGGLKHMSHDFGTVTIFRLLWLGLGFRLGKGLGLRLRLRLRLE